MVCLCLLFSAECNGQDVDSKQMKIQLEAQMSTVQDTLDQHAGMFTSLFAFDLCVKWKILGVVSYPTSEGFSL